MEQVKAEPVELKPCPLCGGEARCSENWPTWDTREWAAYCYDDCGCVVSKRTVAEAIAAWNQRATPQPAAVDGLVEALAPFKAEFQDLGLNAHIADDDLMLDVDCGGEILTAGHWRALMKALAQVERPDDAQL